MSVEPIRTVVELGNSFLLWLGGGGVLIAASCGFISKVVADRTIESHKSNLSTELERLKGELTKEGESHKLELRKAEILFGLQIEAATAFLTLSHKIRPQYARPDMDWHDACEDTANRMGRIESDLSDFQNVHGAVISSTAREMIANAITLAAHHKFIASDETPPREAIEAAGRLLDAVRDIETLLLTDIRA